MYEEDDRKQEQSGSGFINLETMLGLNETQGGQMADAVTGTAQNKLADARQGIAAGQSKFAGDTAKAVQAGSAGAGAYSGPKSFGESAPEVRSQVAAAKGAISGLGTQTGNAQALNDQYVKGQNYSAGQRGFDAFLAGGKIDEKAGGLKSSLSELEGQLGMAEEGADQQYVAAKQQYTSNLNDFYAKQAAQQKAEQEAAEAAAREQEWQDGRWYGLDQDEAKNKKIRDESRGFGGWR